MRNLISDAVNLISLFITLISGNCNHIELTWCHKNISVMLSFSNNDGRFLSRRGTSAGIYQHGGADVKLLSQLSDVDVHRHKFMSVHLLHLSYDVRHPLELTLSPCHPDKIHLEPEYIIVILEPIGNPFFNDIVL